MKELLLAGVVKQSITDGPGLRFTIFTQGCPHACKGCHNPETWSFHGGKVYTIEEILKDFDANPLLKGMTLSGGEPLCQAEALVPLVKEIKNRGKDVVCYTGYLLEDLLKMQQEDTSLRELLATIDYLVDGPYREEERDLTLQFRGSKNQRLLDLPASIRQETPVFWET